MADPVSQPDGRMRIVCTPSEDEGEMELPLRMLFVGDFVGKDERPLEERVPVRVESENFAKVLAAHGPRLDLTVAGVRARLSFRALTDFAPDAVAEQIPEVDRLLALRDGLTALKESRDVDAFRARLLELVPEPEARERLLATLRIEAP